MRHPLTRREAALLAGFAALLLGAVFGPAIANPAGAHAFADARTLWGVPHALDVLSNLPFLAAALAGGRLLLAGVERATGAQKAAMAVFFAGLALTAVGSSWYHLAPDDAGLVVDRLSMAVAFAGLIALAVATQVSERAGFAALAALLVAAPAAVATWGSGGNVLPWAAVQFGGMVTVVALAFVRARPMVLGVNWVLVIAVYALAKLLELQDAAVFAATGEWISGHTLKHLVAACAALPVLSAMGRTRAARQNARGPVRRAAGQY